MMCTCACVVSPIRCMYSCMYSWCVYMCVVSPIRSMFTTTSWLWANYPLLSWNAPGYPMLTVPALFIAREQCVRDRNGGGRRKWPKGVFMKHPMLCPFSNNSMATYGASLEDPVACARVCHPKRRRGADHRNTVQDGGWGAGAKMLQLSSIFLTVGWSLG